MKLTRTYAKLLVSAGALLAVATACTTTTQSSSTSSVLANELQREMLLQLELSKTSEGTGSVGLPPTLPEASELVERVGQTRVERSEDAIQSFARPNADELFRLGERFESDASRPRLDAFDTSPMQAMHTATKYYVAAARLGQTGAVQRLKRGLILPPCTRHTQETAGGEIFDADAVIDRPLCRLDESGTVRFRGRFTGEIVLKDWLVAKL